MSQSYPLHGTKRKKHWTTNKQKQVNMTRQCHNHRPFHGTKRKKHWTTDKQNQVDMTRQCHNHRPFHGTKRKKHWTTDKQKQENMTRQCHNHTHYMAPRGRNTGLQTNKNKWIWPGNVTIIPITWHQEEETLDYRQTKTSEYDQAMSQS